MAARIPDSKDVAVMIPSCPSCGYDDRVRSVLALRIARVSTIHGADHYSGLVVSPAEMFSDLGSDQTERTTVSNLASLLAPEPPRPAGARLFRLALLLTFLPLLGLLVAMKSTPAPALSAAAQAVTHAVAILILATPSIVVAWVAARQVRHTARTDRGRPIELTVWRQAFYCGRCHHCYRGQ
ncbi:hypothetical protein [Nocardia terpenica]|uniref:hypothetical protein n=1 Tax=Nocardia terpenica TaxID=455432 RepID=UPI0012FD0F79|nr:hypothetical protein [Nocardia terpenica]